MLRSTFAAVTLILTLQPSVSRAGFFSLGDNMEATSSAESSTADSTYVKSRKVVCFPIVMWTMDGVNRVRCAIGSKHGSSYAEENLNQSPADSFPTEYTFGDSLVIVNILTTAIAANNSIQNNEKTPEYASFASFAIGSTVDDNTPTVTRITMPMLNLVPVFMPVVLYFDNEAKIVGAELWRNANQKEARGD